MLVFFKKRSRTVTLKVGIVGDTGVGKRTMGKLVSTIDIYPDEYLESIGTIVTKFTYATESEVGPVSLSLMVWDITGKREFRRIRPTYYTGIEGLIGVADASRPDTIDGLDSWVSAVIQNTGPIEVAFVLSKTDLVTEHEVRTLLGQLRQVASRWNASVFQYSKRDPSSAKAMMADLAVRLVRRFAQKAKDRERKKKSTIADATKKV